MLSWGKKALMKALVTAACSVEADYCGAQVGVSLHAIIKHLEGSELSTGAPPKDKINAEYADSWRLNVTCSGNLEHVRNPYSLSHAETFREIMYSSFRTCLERAGHTGKK